MLLEPANKGVHLSICCDKAAANIEHEFREHGFGNIETSAATFDDLLVRETAKACAAAVAPIAGNGPHNHLSGSVRWTAPQRDARIKELVDLTRTPAQYRVESVLAWPNYHRVVKSRIPPETDNPYFLCFYNIIISFAEFMNKANIEGVVDWVLDDQGRTFTCPRDNRRICPSPQRGRDY
jgi:hypothetical protein